MMGLAPMGNPAMIAMLVVTSVCPSLAQPMAQPKLAPGILAVDPASECEAAILHAEKQYSLPHGMLLAIGLAESGRVDAVSRRTRPWPWAVQDGENSHYFETKAEAVAWVAQARQTGRASIDTGCLQVNLFYHPTAFTSLDAAFDPAVNVDYAARFLLRLYAESNDWGAAIGFYHSRTEALAAPYRDRVQTTMGLHLSRKPTVPAEPTVAASLALAWHATTPPAGRGSELPAGGSWNALLAVSPPITPSQHLSPVGSRRVHSDGAFYLATTTEK